MPDQSPPQSQGIHRLLSMDGGGIYGLATAMMLKSLCQRNEQFLSKGDVWMFAGTSAGALNSLLLAHQETPREFVLSGELEYFWRQYGLFAGYDNPQDQWLSLWSAKPWFSPEPFRNVLKQYFGDLTLGQLKNNVLITTFDWSGGGKGSWRPKMFYNFPESEKDRSARVVDVAYAAGAPPGMRAIPGGLGDGGIFVPNPAVNAIAKAVSFFSPHGLEHVLPILFYLSDAIEAQSEFLFGLDTATQPPLEAPLDHFEDRFRAHIAPLLDLELNDPDIEQHLNALTSLTSGTPSTLDQPDAIKELLHGELQLLEATYRLFSTASEHPDAQGDGRVARMLTRARNYRDKIPSGVSIYPAAEHLLIATQSMAQIIARMRGFLNVILERLRMLSLGVCSILPSLTEENYDAGLYTFFALPTNPPQGNYWPPSTFIGLDAPSEDAVYISRQLIHQRFHRLSPQLFGPPDTMPTIPATLYARNKDLHPLAIAVIEKVISTSPKAAEELRRTELYLRLHWNSPTP